jgi:MHS family citrate/tricarballylate:H+ symporter-like MFS transporter
MAEGPGGTIAQPFAGLKRRHIAAATLGNALEFYDFLTYTFFAIQIGHAFFPAQSAYGSLMLSLATFGVGFATRPVGAIVLGAYADRVGRKPAMILSYTMIGASIIAMALIPTYASIGLAAPILAVVARMVQGFSLGGEVGSNTAFLLEGVAPERRGFTVSWQGSSQLIALTVGGVVGTILTALMPHDLLDTYGWRIAFLLGAATLPFGLWLRNSLPETLHQPETVAVAPAQGTSRLRLAQNSIRIMILGLVVLACGTIGSYIFTYIVTYAQNTLHMKPILGFVAETGGYVLGAVTVLYGGWLSDRYGRWPVNVYGNLLFLVLIYPTFYWVVATHSAFALIAGMILLAGIANFTFGCVCATLAEGLPKPIRGSGFAVVYSVAISVFGGTTQFVVTWLIHVTGSALAPAWYLLAATAVAQVAMMMIPESAPAKVARLRSGPSGAAVLATPN